MYTYLLILRNEYPKWIFLNEYISNAGKAFILATNETVTCMEKVTPDTANLDVQILN
jgi:hypothetical protein